MNIKEWCFHYTANTSAKITNEQELKLLEAMTKEEFEDVKFPFYVINNKYCKEIDPDVVLEVNEEIHFHVGNAYIVEGDDWKKYLKYYKLEDFVSPLDLNKLTLFSSELCVQGEEMLIDMNGRVKMLTIGCQSIRWSSVKKAAKVLGGFTSNSVYIQANSKAEIAAAESITIALSEGEYTSIYCLSDLDFADSLTYPSYALLTDYQIGMWEDSKPVDGKIVPFNLENFIDLLQEVKEGEVISYSDEYLDINISGDDDIICNKHEITSKELHKIIDFIKKYD